LDDEISKNINLNKIENEIKSNLTEIENVQIEITNINEKIKELNQKITSINEIFKIYDDLQSLKCEIQPKISEFVTSLDIKIYNDKLLNLNNWSVILKVKFNESFSTNYTFKIINYKKLIEKNIIFDYNNYSAFHTELIIVIKMNDNIFHQKLLSKTFNLLNFITNENVQFENNPNIILNELNYQKIYTKNSTDKYKIYTIPISNLKKTILDGVYLTHLNEAFKITNETIQCFNYKTGIMVRQLLDFNDGGEESCEKEYEKMKKNYLDYKNEFFEFNDEVVEFLNLKSKILGCIEKNDFFDFDLFFEKLDSLNQRIFNFFSLIRNNFL
jgi:hypothetical protein